MLSAMRTGGYVLISCAVVIGPPGAALWWWQHTAWSLPSRSSVDAWVADPTAGVGIAILLALGVFAVWLLSAVAALVATARQGRQMWAQLKRVHLPTPAQATATSMAGAAVLAAPGLGLGVVGEQPPQPVAQLTALGGQPDSHGDLPAESRKDGIQLADGSWLPAATVNAVLLAATLYWLRRRREHRPGPGATHGRDQLPETVAAIQHQAAELVSEDDPPPPATGGWAEPTLISALPATAVGLVGPGATAAARGALVTSLFSRTPDYIVITADLLRHLLGAAASTVRPPTMIIAADLDAALTQLHTSAPDDGGAHRLLLAMAPNAADDIDRLDAALRSCHAAAILLGAWPRGITSSVRADGTITGQATQRWCVLTEQAAADLWTLTAHRAPNEPALALASPDLRTVSNRYRQRDTSAAPKLDLKVLGRPALISPEGPVVVRRTAALQILVLLAIDHDGVGAGALGAALWPGEPFSATGKRVYTTISELRKLLSEQAGAPVLLRDDDRYRLDPEAIRVDLWQLERALDAVETHHDGTPADADPESQAATLSDLYTGELAAGKVWPWLDQYREHLRHRLLDAFAGLTENAAPSA